MPKLIQGSFAAGELAPRLHGRVDFAKYHQGVSYLRNWVVDYRGGVSIRPGQEFIGFVRDQTAKPRQLRFVFNTSQTYDVVLDAGGGARFVNNGAFVLEAPITVTAGTAANPLTITAPGHNFVVNDDVFVDGVVGLARTNGVSGINGRTVRVTVIAGDVLTLAALPTVTNINSSTWTAYTSGGTVSRVYTVDHPWTAAALPDLNYSQLGDTMTVVHPDFPIYEIKRFGTTNWTITQKIIGTQQQPVTDLAADDVNNAGGMQFFTPYIVTAVDNSTNEESIASNVASAINSTLDQNTGVCNQLTWTGVPGASVYRVYSAQPVPSGEQGPGPYFYGLIAESYATQFNDLNYTRDFTIVPPTSVNPFESGHVSSAVIDRAGFGYIAPQWLVADPRGSGALIVPIIDSTGAIVTASVSNTGNDEYVAPTSYISETDTTLGSGLVVNFSGSFITNLDGSFSPAPGSITIGTPGAHYHVPVVTLTAQFAFNILNIDDQSGNITLDVSSLIATIASAPSLGSGIRAVRGVDTGKKYFEYVTGVSQAGVGLATADAIFATAFGGLGIYQYRSSDGNSFFYAWDAIMADRGTLNGNRILKNDNLMASGPVPINGHVIGVAFDADAQLVWFIDWTAAGDWNNNPAADPAAGAGGLSTVGLSNTTLFPITGAPHVITTGTLGTFNFSNVPAWTGTAPAGFDPWEGPPGDIGQNGVYYYTTLAAVPSTLNTVTIFTVPYTAGLTFTIDVVDTLPGTTIEISGARGHVLLSGQHNPSQVTYFDQRQMFAATNDNPDTFWLTRIGLYGNFDVSFPSQGDDAITGTIVAQEVNAINSLTPMASGVIALTTNGAYQISGGTPGAALTPSDITAAAQASSGADPLRPIRANYDVLFQTARGNAIRDISYNFYVNIYTGTDVSALASHLFDGHRLTDWTYAEAPNYLVWGVRDDGNLLAFAYLKEQELYGWSHCDTAGQYTGVVSIPEDRQDAVYFSVRRYFPGLDGFYYVIERLADAFIGANFAANVPPDPEKAWQVDCGVTYPLDTPVATLTGASVCIKGLSDPVIVDGGSNYTAPIVLIEDPTGTGGEITLTLTAGVITGFSVTRGTNYQSPQFTIIDSTGEGGIISTGVINRWTITIDGPSVFQMSGEEGKVVRFPGARGTIISVTNPTTAVVDFDIGPFSVLANVPGATQVLMPVESGDWSATLPVDVIGGLDFAEGSYVQIVADGGVLDPQMVEDGCVVLPAPASAIVAGFGFTAQMRTLRLDAGQPTIQTDRKQITALTMRLVEARALRCGPTFDDLTPIKDRSADDPLGTPIPFDAGGGVISPYQENGPQAFRPMEGSKDLRTVIDTRWQENGYICIQADLPMPATVVALIPDLQIGDDEP